MMEIVQMANLKEKKGFCELILPSTCLTPLHWNTGFVAVAESAP